MDTKVTFLVDEELVEIFDKKVKGTGFNRTEALVALMKATITGGAIVLYKGVNA